MRRQRAALVHKLIGEVFNGMTQDFQGVTGLRCNVPAPFGGDTRKYVDRSERTGPGASRNE